MNHPLIHHVTPHNQGAPCNLHAQSVQPDTVEVHFGFVSAPIIPCSRNCFPSKTERSNVTQAGNESNAPTSENSTTAYADNPPATLRAGNASEDGAK